MKKNCRVGQDEGLLHRQDLWDLVKVKDADASHRPALVTRPDLTAT